MTRRTFTADDYAAAASAVMPVPASAIRKSLQRQMLRYYLHLSLRGTGSQPDET